MRPLDLNGYIMRLSVRVYSSVCVEDVDENEIFVIDRILIIV